MLQHGNRNMTLFLVPLKGVFNDCFRLFKCPLIKDGT